MDCTRIPYTQVPKSSPLLLDYLYHFDRVAHFYNGPPFELASYKAVADNLAGFHYNRQELTDVLRRQNQDFGCESATFSNIERLSKPGTLAVVTGQQVGLMSGPAFTLYKALTAVRLAQSLSEQGLAAVPVFWLATEDHDLEEVSQTLTFDEDYNLVPLSTSAERPAPRCSVGYVRFLKGIEEILAQIEGTLPTGEPRARLLQDLRASYKPGATWGQAFGRFMARLFSRWGVVLLDPLDERIHRLTGPLYSQALAQGRQLRNQLRERSQALSRAGYHPQVHLADDSTLVFISNDGNRVHVAQNDEQPQDEFLIEGVEKVTLARLRTRIEEQPIDFSANVLLRPVVQDILLPTVAYVAGPSELAYLGQAESLYRTFGRSMPVIFPRAGFTLLDRRVQRLLEKYHLSVEDVWKGEEHLSEKIAGAGSVNWSERFDHCQQELERILTALQPDIEHLDTTLVDTLKHAQEKMIYQLDRLKSKVSRSALAHSELLTRHEQSLLRFLTPDKSLQEREIGGFYFIGRAGYELLDRLLSQIQVHSSDHQLLTY